ncbi:MAG: putative manganese transporter [Prevotellaceae bacterium]|nr:putative manganese transporter [Prevotellaceae bacterium]
MIHDIFDILRNSLLITGLVMVMMLVIEYANIISGGQRLLNLQNSRLKQLIVAALLGLVPGCIGGFVIVSLFAHGIVNFGALTAVMIVSLGDEAFMMFAAIPETAVIIVVLLFAVAVFAGFIINIFIKNAPLPDCKKHFEIQADKNSNIHGNILQNIKSMTYRRAVLILGIAVFVFGISSGLLDHSHEPQFAGENRIWHLNLVFNEHWLNMVFAVISIATLYIILKVSDDFLNKHLWGHIIKKHFVKIFLWTLIALLAIYFLLHFININEWTSNNRVSVLLFALLVGLIPESGPHIIFIVLFMNGSVPFSVLMANSFVQDGHSALPLLAESKKSFVYMKLIKLAIGIITGFAGIFAGF